MSWDTGVIRRFSLIGIDPEIVEVGLYPVLRTFGRQPKNISTRRMMTENILI